MFILKNRDLRLLTAPVDSDGRVVRPLNVDQYPSQEFNCNRAGWTSNDLSLLERASTLAESERILARLQSIRANNPSNAGKSDADLIREIKPAWVQTPSEIDKFMRYQASYIESKIGSPSDVDVHVSSLSPEAVDSSE